MYTDITFQNQDKLHWDWNPRSPRITVYIFDHIVLLFFLVQETGIRCTRCASHTGYLAHLNKKGEAKRRRSRHNNNGRRIVRNLEERNVGTKRKSPKIRRLTSTEELTIKLPRDASPPTIDKTN